MSTISPALAIVPLGRHNLAHAAQLGKELHALSSLRDIPFDWDLSLYRLKWAAAQPNWFVELSCVNGTYTGFVMGKVEAFTFSMELLGQEVAWFVRPGTPARTRMGIALMRRFVNWCIEEKRCLRVHTGDIANIDAKAVDAVYRHMGFARYGANYCYVPQSVTGKETA